MTVEPLPAAALGDAARSAARLSKSIEVALSELGVSLPQYRLLAFLSGGPERASALAEWLSVSPPSLTALVDGAVSRGLVERVAVQDDRRAVRHVMTDAGVQTLAKADEAVASKLSSLLDHLSASDARKAAEGLALVGKALDAARAAADADAAAEAAAKEEARASRQRPRAGRAERGKGDPGRSGRAKDGSDESAAAQSSEPEPSRR